MTPSKDRFSLFMVWSTFSRLFFFGNPTGGPGGRGGFSWFHKDRLVERREIARKEVGGGGERGRGRD